MPAWLVAEFDISRKLGWPAQDCTPALHDALLKSVALVAGKDVSDALHDGRGSGRKPYAISPLWAGASGRVSATIGILDDSLSGLFSEALKLMELVVAGQRLRVRSVEETLPRKTYVELLTTGSEDQWDLEFLTPTVFRIPGYGRHPERWILLPEPRLVVGRSRAPGMPGVAPLERPRPCAGAKIPGSRHPKTSKSCFPSAHLQSVHGCPSALRPCRSP
jgi:hypothetical protein